MKLTSPQRSLLTELQRSGTSGVKVRGHRIKVARNLARKGLCTVTAYPDGPIADIIDPPKRQSRVTYTCEPRFDWGERGCSFCLGGWGGRQHVAASCELDPRLDIQGRAETTIPKGCPLRPSNQGPLTVSIDEDSL